MKYFGTLEQAKRSWNREVEKEAARFIERGIYPHRAIDEAIEIVSERRKAKYESEAHNHAHPPNP